MMFGLSLDFFGGGYTIDSPTALWWKQLATAVVFGLAFSNVLTLIFTPALLAMRVWIVTYAVWLAKALLVLGAPRSAKIAQDWALSRSLKKVKQPNIIWDEDELRQIGADPKHEALPPPEDALPAPEKQESMRLEEPKPEDQEPLDDETASVKPATLPVLGRSPRSSRMLWCHAQSYRHIIGNFHRAIEGIHIPYFRFEKGLKRPKPEIHRPKCGFSTKIGMQDLWQLYGPICLLSILQNGNERAAHRKTRSV